MSRSENGIIAAASDTNAPTTFGCEIRVGARAAASLYSSARASSRKSSNRYQAVASLMVDSTASHTSCKCFSSKVGCTRNVKLVSPSSAATGRRSGGAQPVP